MDKGTHAEIKAERKLQAMTKRARINFGKIDYNKTGRKINLVSVDLELRDTEKGVEFSATGAIWNARKTDWICGGQCLDTIGEYVRTPLFNEILRFWHLYHLNAMRVGTEKQEYFLKGYFSTLCIKSFDYETAKKVLQANNLYDDNGNKYGCAWYYHEIPEVDLKRINEIIDKYTERG